MEGWGDGDPKIQVPITQDKQVLMIRYTHGHFQQYSQLLKLSKDESSD